MNNIKELSLQLPMVEDEYPETNADNHAEDHPLEVPAETLEIGGEIESGSFGVVRFGMWHTKPVAIKFQKNLKLAQQEADLHHKLSHPNIVLLLAVSKLNHQHLMILEKMDVDLLIYLNSAQQPLTKALNISEQIVQGLAYLHNEMHVLHRDLKPENILLKGDEVKIADMGLAISTDSHTKSNPHILLGPWQGYAPELIWATAPFTTKTDIYALAILLYEIATSASPYTTENSEIPKTLYSIKNGKRPVVKSDNPFRTLIINCWDANAAKRPEATEVLEMLRLISLQTQAQIQEADKENICSNTIEETKGSTHSIKMFPSRTTKEIETKVSQVGLRMSRT